MLGMSVYRRDSMYVERKMEVIEGNSGKIDDCGVLATF